MAVCRESRTLGGLQSSHVDTKTVKDRLMKSLHAKTLGKENNTVAMSNLSQVLQSGGEPKEELVKKTQEFCTMSDLCPQDKQTIANVLRQILQLTEINEETLSDLHEEREAKRVLSQENEDLKGKNSALELKLEQAIDLLRQYQIRMRDLYETLQRTEQELELTKTLSVRECKECKMKVKLYSDDHEEKQLCERFESVITDSTTHLFKSVNEDNEEEIPSPNCSIPSPHLPNTIDQAISEFAKALSFKYGGIMQMPQLQNRNNVPFLNKPKDIDDSCDESSRTTDRVIAKIEMSKDLVHTKSIRHKQAGLTADDVILNFKK
ncbi:hypothetical protein GUITHDRAFT_109352 [Guillardia theta CCMP2712]|uniref:Uncharacterized protein n=1 Tax=Guillardia theta (strain CCMP2712) TaxID=905079 RepID=L1J7S0_GUITC|nr:hypothetical protein GUITHDRAFT_109352 [Guillardia theta CCMP2712]EKX44576.1 hypothetical protein GUITHDRAFT_109352 [Guillardia theta CCMP2712]|eukprot:XP_005831556.1 hypothetical protein GUITHDRAFT_109352 [Guillardia theta CCMP2712]